MQHVKRRVPAAASRSGYTAIELMIVLGVIVVLSSMAIPAILPALRKGRVNEAANAILSVAQQARLLAIQRTPPADNKHYGVVVVDDPARKNTAVVALIYGAPGDGKSSDYGDLVSDYGRILTKTSGGKTNPVSLYEFPASVAVWVGDSELRSQATKYVTWYYNYQNGLPIGVSGGTFTTSAISVGSPALTLTQVWGRTQNPALVVDAVAAGTANNPGLSVRSLDNRAKRAVAVYVSGLPFTGEF